MLTLNVLFHNHSQLAYPVKWALAYLGVDYEEKKYPLSQAGLEEYGAEKGNLGLDLPNVCNKKLKYFVHS